MLNKNKVPDLTPEEYKILHTILSLVKSNMKKLEKGSYVFSECEFVFDIDYGILDTFASLFNKVDLYGQRITEI